MPGLSGDVRIESALTISGAISILLLAIVDLLLPAIPDYFLTNEKGRHPSTDAFPQVIKFPSSLFSTDSGRHYHIMDRAHFLDQLIVLFERQCLRAI